MVVLIIAGGYGTRLWPLSTREHPKHLLKIDGDSHSLLQQTYDRAKLLTEDIYVITEVNQIDAIMQQLPDLSEDNFIIEPAPRGTANCFIAALDKLKDKYDQDEVLAFMHADHYIRDLAGFANSFNLAKHIASRLNRIVLIGAEPDYPSTNFGYIERGELVEDQTFTYKVKSFKEKPDFETAKSYIRAGNYLWNCGYFVGSIATFIKSIKKQSNELYKNFIKLSSAKAGTYDELYKSLRNETIDYALIEKLDNLLVVPASFDWMDIGSFNDLSNALGGDELGNNIQGNVVTEDVDNSLIQNHENKPLAVIGLDNVVVVNTKDGLIVLRKDLAIKVKEITNRISK